MPVAFEVVFTVARVRRVGCLVLLLWRWGVKDWVAVEVEALVLEGADDAVSLGLCFRIFHFEMGLCVAAGMCDVVSWGWGGLRCKVLPREVADFLAAQGTAGFLGDERVVQFPLGFVARLGPIREVLVDFVVTVVASDFKVVEAFRVGLVCDLRVRFLLIAKDAIALKVLSRACLGSNWASGWLGRSDIRLVIIAVAHEELLIVARRGHRGRSGARGTNRLSSVIFAGGQEVGQRFGRVGVFDASLARGDWSRVLIVVRPRRRRSDICRYR